MSCTDDSLAALPVSDESMTDMWHAATVCMSVVRSGAICRVRGAYHLDVMGFESKKLWASVVSFRLFLAKTQACIFAKTHIQLGSNITLWSLYCGT